MPTDAALENAWYQACQTRQAAGTIPGRSFEDRGGRSPLIIKDLDLYPQPPTNTRSPTLNSEEPEIAFVIAE